MRLGKNTIGEMQEYYLRDIQTLHYMLMGKSERVVGGYTKKKGYPLNKIYGDTDAMARATKIEIEEGRKRENEREAGEEREKRERDR